MNIKIHILHCGSVGIDVATTRLEKTIHPAPYSGIFRSKINQIVVPVSAYLIEHPKGLVLVDTGWHTDVRTNPKNYLGRLHYHVSTPYLPDGQAIHEHLVNLGFKTSDIGYVLLSHLHTDHVSGLKLVKDAANIVVSDIELKEAHQSLFTYKSAMWEGTKLRTFSFVKSNYGSENLSFDLFGDDSAVLVSTPGHTKGLTSTLIQNNGKFVLLCSDVGYMQESWKNLITPGITTDKAKALSCLQWVKEMSEREECVRIIANHDPEMHPQVIVL